MNEAAILAMGTVAIDSVETPLGKRERCFGGSASYFSYAASFFTRTKILAVVGEDFPPAYRAVLEDRHIDLSGIEVKKGEKTFFWKGKYAGAMNEAETLVTELNTLLSFKPQLTAQDNQPVLFLANIDPAIQYEVICEKKKTEFVLADTMNFWIANKRDDLLKVLGRINALIINEGEARQLSGRDNLIQAGDVLRSYGPSIIVIKKGEHGALLFFNDEFCALPAFPVRHVTDPTGAGDSFAGGMIGFLARERTYDFATFKKAIMWGTVIASFTVEDFSLDRLKCLTGEELTERFAAFQNMITI